MRACSSSRTRPRDAALEFAWSTAATLDPCVDGASFFPRIFADVEAARSSVHILMFGWREGEVGMRMAALLEQKLSEGLEVRVIVDGLGSRPYAQANEMFTRLAAAGAQVVVNDALPPVRAGLFPAGRAVWRLDGLGRVDHRKLYIVDGNVIWTGGAGLEDHFDDGRFHDLMVRVTGDVVRQAQAAFLTSFRGHGGPLPADLSRLFPAPAEPGPTPIALAQVIPGGFLAASQALQEQIDGAGERLDVMNPYFTDPDIVERVLAAARRGVEVRVVVSQKSNSFAATAALRHRYAELNAAGAVVWELPGTVVHAKVVVADDVVSFGTVNHDAWALYRNSELMMLARSPALAALVMGVHRFITGTPPRRRALAIGTPVALLFLLCEILYQLLTIVGADDSELYGVVIWVFVAARASVWYGFLFALIAAELFAARAMGRLVEQSLDHPSKQELELMLREPLGDPQLRLQFLPDSATDPDAERQAVEAGPGRDVTVVQRDGSPAVAIVHDAQLDDDPELLNAAGAIALLAAENAELDAGWKEAMGDLERSRTRLVRAADEERRKFERNLHDGVQQQLIAIKIWLELTAEATVDGATRDRLIEIAGNVESALDEVRAVSHGLYPQLLLDSGLVAALQSIQRRTPVPLSFDADGVGRYSPEVESAVYYSCLEAIQNATKHGGPNLHISVMLRQDGDQVRFDVEDDGAGFEAELVTGTGLQNMQDRLGAVGGRLTVRTAPGHGTRVSGRVPQSTRSNP